jgi:hypothetical protein
VPRLEREPSFLPLTINATYAVARATADTPALRATAEQVRERAHRADEAAAECWAALCAGCDAPGRRALPNRLHELTEATSVYAGTRWWFGRGAQHVERVSGELARIEEAVDERDGAEFAEAFVGYDQAVAAVLVNSHDRLETPAQ